MAVCFAGGFNIDRNMVYTGWAPAYRRYSSDYVDTEEVAQVSQAGLFASR